MKAILIHTKHCLEIPFTVHFSIEALNALKPYFNAPFSDFDALANAIKIFQKLLNLDMATVAKRKD